MADKNFQLIDEPTENIALFLEDGRIIKGRRGATLEEFVLPLKNDGSPMIVGAIVDGSLRELTFPVNREAEVRLVTMADSDGASIYRRSLTFLLTAAFHACFPRASIAIDHSVSSGGYYCQVNGLPGFSAKELAFLEQTMRKMVEQDIKFVRETVPLEEAVAHFTSVGEDDKVRLLKYRLRKNLVLYRAGETRDYHHGYMVPSAGYLQWFDMVLVEGAFIIRFPRRHAPTELSPMTSYPTLLKTFRDYGNWLEKLGIPSVGALNDAIEDGHIDEVILVSEALHEMQISDIAEEIDRRKDQVSIILIAGPSSSGKTTTSKRLSIQLIARGITPFALEMDNYFVDREKTPRNPDGSFDFESLHAMDVKRLNFDLSRMIQGEEVTMPRYDFKTGKSVAGKVVRLKKGDMIILEGIHGLNPELLTDIKPENTYKLYVSCLTQLNLDRHNRISTTDTRMLRRIVRDARDRGYSAEDTINRWEAVRNGEKNHIFPYQENADAMFNTALVYELGTLKPLAEPLLRQVPYGTPAHIEAKRLLKFLEWFLPTGTEYVPNNSILREFIGGSVLTHFELWKQ